MDFLCIKGGDLNADIATLLQTSQLSQLSTPTMNHLFTILLLSSLAYFASGHGTIKVIDESSEEYSSILNEMHLAVNVKHPTNITGGWFDGNQFPPEFFNSNTGDGYNDAPS